jgi:NTP pyrophosphatase (non-canonical NTP hydrolase)
MLPLDGLSYNKRSDVFEEVSSMTFGDLQKEIVAFRDERDWRQFHSPENLAKSVTIEAAELLECFQWDGEYDTRRITEEVADVFIYLVLFCEETGIDLMVATEGKMKTNSDKYPVAKAKGSSKKYTEFDENG